MINRQFVQLSADNLLYSQFLIERRIFLYNIIKKILAQNSWNYVSLVLLDIREGNGDKVIDLERCFVKVPGPIRR